MKRIDRVGEFEHLILLALLRLGDNAYGVKIQQEIGDRTGRRITFGAIYTALARLEQKGYISSWTGDPTPERGGRAKKFFKIEASGQRALGNSVAAQNAMAEGIVLQEAQ